MLRLTSRLVLILGLIALVIWVDVHSSATSCGLCNVPSFRAARRFPAGNISVAGAIGDFNGDSKSDLAIANRDSNDISILLGDGTGNFGPPTNFIVSSGVFGPFDIAVGDFNADNKLDLAAATFLSGVVVLIGNGAGGFGPPSSIAVLFQPFSIAVGDFNHDANLDIVAGGMGGTILLGNGQGGFTEGTSFDVGFDRDLAVADLNNDGDADLIVLRDTFVSILLGDGMGNLGAPASFPVGPQALSLALGDLNNDEKLDIATGNGGPVNVSILLGDGVGSFGPTIDLGEGAAFSIAIGKFNDDDYLDLATVEAKDNALWLSVRLGQGSATFGAPTKYATGEQPNTVLIGNFNGDDNRDLAVVNLLSGSSIFLGDGVGKFEGASLVEAGPSVRFTAVVDFNSDDKPDLLTAGGNGDQNVAGVSVFLGDGMGGFADPVNLPTCANPQSAAIGDFNNDNKLDVAVADLDCHILSVFLGDGTGAFGSATNYTVGTSPWSIVTNDFNADNSLDLAVANTDSHNVSILLGDGTGSFGTATNLSVGSGPRFITASHLNGDVYPDLITANGQSVSVLIGNGVGGFEPAAHYSSGGASPVACATGDFNGDNWIDVAIANANSHFVSILFGNGSGGFSTTAFLPVGENINHSSPNNVAVSDFNSDNKQDLAVTTRSSGIFIFFGHGDGGFGPSRAFSGGENSSLTVADWNLDGKPDLAVGGSQRQVAILLNTCTPNTPVGNEVLVQASLASLLFNSVATAGTTNVTTIDPSTVGEVPGGFAVSELIAYQIETTAIFTGPVTIGFVIPNPISEAEFNSLRILHAENGVLVDVTASSPVRTYSNRTIYAVTNSFSPFYLVRSGIHIATLFDRSKAYKSGSTIPIKLRLLDSADSNISSSGTVLTTRSLRLIGGSTNLPVLDSGNANPDNNFRFESTLSGAAGYAFNLSTKGLAAGQYVLSFYAGTDRSFFYTIRFEVR